MPVSTVVITGATGYIGSQLLLSLLSGFPDEVRLRVVARESSECGFLDGLPVEVVRADIGDQLALNDAFSGADTVFHCAGLISYARHFRNVLYAINTAGSASVVNACLQSGVRRLAMTSSIAAAGVPEDGSMVTEASSFQDWQHRNGYAESKHLAELEGLRGVAEGLEVVTISPGVVIGRDPLNPASLSSSNDVLRMVHKGLVPVFPTGGTGLLMFVMLLMRLLQDGGKGGREKGILWLVTTFFSVSFLSVSVIFMEAPEEKRFLCPGWLGSLPVPVVNCIHCCSTAPLS